MSDPRIDRIAARQAAQTTGVTFGGKVYESVIDNNV